MPASKSALLILNRPRGRLQIEPMDEYRKGLVSAPLEWLVFRRFQHAKLLDSDLKLSSVSKAAFAAIEGPGEDGWDSIYITMLTLGWLTLSVPIRVQLSLVDIKTLTLDEARNEIDTIVLQSRMASDDRNGLSKRIKRAMSVSEMAHAVSQARE